MQYEFKLYTRLCGVCGVFVCINTYDFRRLSLKAAHRYYTLCKEENIKRKRAGRERSTAAAPYHTSSYLHFNIYIVIQSVHLNCVILESLKFT